MDHLMTIDYKIAQTLSKRGHVTAITLDFEKAFDRIGKHMIIYQLIEWNFSNKYIQYINNLLTNRTIIAKVNNIYLKTTKKDNGIVQGSPISSTLFIIVQQSQ